MTQAVKIVSTIVLLFIEKEGSHKFLNESTNGLVMVRCGNPPPLSQFAENCFRCDHDPLYCADGSQRPLDVGQKPVEWNFMKNE